MKDPYNLHKVETIASDAIGMLIFTTKKQLDFIDKEASTRILTDTQKMYVSQRRQVFNNILEEAQAAYTTAKLVEKQFNDLKQFVKIQPALAVLKATRNPEQEFKAWKAMQTKTTVYMDFNQNRMI